MPLFLTMWTCVSCGSWGLLRYLNIKASNINKSFILLNSCGLSPTLRSFVLRPSQGQSHKQRPGLISQSEVTPQDFIYESRSQWSALWDAIWENVLIHACNYHSQALWPKHTSFSITGGKISERKFWEHGPPWACQHTTNTWGMEKWTVSETLSYRQVSLHIAPKSHGV